MQAEADGLLMDGDTVTGVQAKTPEGLIEIRSPLVVAADGRHSTLRGLAGLESEDFGAPMDVLWFRLSKRAGDGSETLGRIQAGRLFVMLDRGDYWQCAYVIAKGSAETVRAQGIEKVRETVSRLMPAFADRVGELKGMDDLKHLTVGVDRLRTWWKPGLLCIGDAAHTMSPIGGVGINVAIQDAVAASNILAAPLREHRLKDSDLAAVQERRLFPARMTQAMQMFLQKRVIAPSLYGRGGALKVPLFLRLLSWFPFLRRLPARLMGLGIRPEHVRTSLSS
jgi:2-polyprenyl-6-methoxyphenol hydroxylase-like FAD-dependent oxidoreductase